MGTGWSALVVDPPASVEADIAAVLRQVIGQMSHWDGWSQLSGFNRAAPGTWHPIAPGFAEVMAAALDIAARSDGAFDPAIGVLVDLWGFGPPGPRKGVPGAAEIALARRASGHDAIDYDPLLLRLRRTRPVRLDLSGIAKGYAVDAVAARLRALGCADFLIEIGGELTGAGIRPDGQPWWVDVETPPGLTLPRLRVALHGLSIATSGDYRRGFEAGGVRLAHTIDPRTGHPATNGIASISVLHPCCMLADAWASALAVAGPDEGAALATREGLAARIVTRCPDGPREWLSPALLAMLD